MAWQLQYNRQLVELGLSCYKKGCMQSLLAFNAGVHCIFSFIAQIAQASFVSKHFYIITFIVTNLLFRRTLGSQIQQSVHNTGCAYGISWGVQFLVTTGFVIIGL